MKRNYVRYSIVSTIVASAGFIGILTSGAAADSITTTGPGSTNVIYSSYTTGDYSANNTTVNEASTANQSASTGSATDYGNTDSGYSGVGSMNWNELNPATYEQAGNSFNSWWTAVMQQLASYAPTSWTTDNSNTNWTPSGIDWQATWSNWDPATWESSGSSYANWYSQLLNYLEQNYIPMMDAWTATNGVGSANTATGGATTGSATNSNSATTSATVTNGSANQLSEPQPGAPTFSDSTISDTGPGSSNGIYTNYSSQFDTTNNTNVGIDNQTNQYAQTGSATVSGNTIGGSAETGNAQNANMTYSEFSVSND